MHTHPLRPLKTLRIVFSCFLLLSVLLIAPPAQAIGLEEAKEQGLVGEQPNGYLGVVKTPASAEVKQLVEEVNRQRQAKYHSIAQSRKTTVGAVEALAGKTAIEKSKPGHFIKANGDWQQK